MSVELFRITDADVLRAKDVWESQCGMVELIGPQMATFHYHSVSPFFVAKFEWLNLAGRPIFTWRPVLCFLSQAPASKPGSHPEFPVGGGMRRLNRTFDGVRLTALDFRLDVGRPLLY
jgi:hypothetical protein